MSNAKQHKSHGRKLEHPEKAKSQKNAQYLTMLDRSMKEARQGNLIPKTISELEKYEE